MLHQALGALVPQEGSDSNREAWNTHRCHGGLYSKQDSYEVRENFLKRRNVHLPKPQVVFSFCLHLPINSLFVFCVVLGVEPRASYMPGKCYHEDATP